MWIVGGSEMATHLERFHISIHGAHGESLMLLIFPTEQNNHRTARDKRQGRCANQESVATEASSKRIQSIQVH